MKLIRLLIRLTGFAGVLLGCPTDWVLTVFLPGRSKDRRARALWLQRWSRLTLRLISCRVRCQGTPPQSGLCASNHVSYLDILVYSSLFPCVFVSKYEVKFWPVFGMFASMGGTLFIRRQRKHHVADIGRQMETVLKNNLPLVIFPEGTSSNGDLVLPFRSSLFEPVVAHQWPVTPLCVRYEIEDGTVADDVAFWRDMLLVPHLIRLFTKKDLMAVVTIGAVLPPGENRKDLCRQAHEAVCRLHEDSK